MDRHGAAKAFKSYTTKVAQLNYELLKQRQKVLSQHIFLEINSFLKDLIDFDCMLLRFLRTCDNGNYFIPIQHEVYYLPLASIYLPQFPVL